MDDLFGAILLAVAGIGSLAAYLATVAYLLPGLTGRAERALETMPGRSFAVGLVNWIFFSIIAALAIAIGGSLPGGLKGLFNLFGLAIALALLAVTSVGLAAMVNLLRGRLTPSPAMPSAKGTFWTAVMLLVAGLSPVVGWFVLTPAALAAGLGAMVIALVLRPKLVMRET